MGDEKSSELLTIEWREHTAERLARIEEGIETIKRCLFGNGQPGRCALENDRIDTIETRLKGVENQLTYHRAVAAVLGGIAGLVAFLGSLIVKLFAKG